MMARMRERNKDSRMSVVVLLVFYHGFVSGIPNYTEGSVGWDNLTNSDFADIKDRDQDLVKLNASFGLVNFTINNSSERYQLAIPSNFSLVDIVDDVMPGNYSEGLSAYNSLSNDTDTLTTSTGISKENVTEPQETILSLQNKSVPVTMHYDIPENRTTAYENDLSENRTSYGNSRRTPSSSDIDETQSLTTSSQTSTGSFTSINTLPLSQSETKLNTTDFLKNMSDVLATVFNYMEKTTVSTISTEVTPSVQTKTTKTIQKHHHGVFQTLLLESLRHGTSSTNHVPVDDDPFESLIWRDKKYLISVLVPIGVGITGSVVIVVVAYFVRSYRRKQKRRAFRSPRRIFKPQAQLAVMDRIVLLDDSSDDGF